MHISIKLLPKFSTIFIAAVITTACGGLSSSDDPELNRFEIRDTSGSDSATDPESEISLSAGENDGEFELYWDIDTDDDYSYEVRINDRDSMTGSLQIFSDRCDPDDSCHDNQKLDCEYRNDGDDLEIICENSRDDEETTNINLIADDDDLPEDLHFILETCDPFGFDCEDQSIRVEFR